MIARSRQSRLMIAMAALAIVNGCSPRVVYRDRIVTVNVPVAQPCAGERPSRGTTLAERYTDAQWAAMDLAQRTAAVGERAIERMDYGDRLDAATAACP